MYCPQLGKECIGKECAWNITLYQANSQTNEVIEKNQCGMTAIPMLISELHTTVKMVNKTNISIDK